MGATLRREQDRFAVGVGNRCVPGIIDHHFDRGMGLDWDEGGGSDLRDGSVDVDVPTSGGDAPTSSEFEGRMSSDCAATLLARYPTLVTNHRLSAPHATVTVVMHAAPDLDAVTSAYFVKTLLEDGKLLPWHHALADYTRRINEGLGPPEGPRDPDSLSMIYVALTETTRDTERLVERAFALLDDVGAWANEAVPGSPLLVRQGDWETERILLREQWRLYLRDAGRAQTFRLPLPVPGGSLAPMKDVQGIFIENPECAIFKNLARADGSVLTHVAWTAERRHIVAVAPDRGVWLRGLGRALEGAEILTRAHSSNLERDWRLGPRRWPDVSNADPWYDGRAPLHGYTIVDSPSVGTLLSTKEVMAIVKDTVTWGRLGRMEMRCPHGCLVPQMADAFYCRSHSDALVPGIVGGHYEVVGFLGKGGVGEVLKAKDTVRSDAPLVALKRLLPELQRGESTVASMVVGQFLREATLTKELRHPHVVRVLGYGVDASLGLFLCTEFLPGLTLDTYLEKNWEHWSSSTPQEFFGWFLRMMIQVCTGLEALHALGVIHRDIKPQNIMLSPDAQGERAVLIDLGLCAPPGRPPDRCFTQGFASPEQILGIDVNVQTDLYLLGATMYWVFFRCLPFPDDDRDPHYYRSKCLPVHVPRIDAGPGQQHTATKLSVLMTELLEPERERRPPSATAVRERLETIQACLA
jgi:hypothetical protein